MADKLAASLPTVQSCPECGSEVAPGLLVCPSCQWLVHGRRLKELAGSAEAQSDREARRKR